MRFLPSYKTRAIEHTCGSPATYYVLKYVEALRRWRCTGCGRIVG